MNSAEQLQGRDTDDARNRRRDTSVELRKNKRVEQLMKKRQTDDSAADEDDVPVDAPDASAGWVAPRGEVMLTGHSD